MESKIKIKENYSQLDTKDTATFLNKMKEHTELIAALTSGALILLGWLLTNYISPMLTAGIFVSAFIIGGYAKAKEGIIETLEDRKLNVELLMIIAAIGSASIGYWLEGAMLIFIFSLSGALETYTMNKSKRELSSLMDLQPEEALLIDGNTQRKVHVKDLALGDMILIKPGERVPVDGQISKGKTTIDESAISGESFPISKETGEDVLAGTVNINGAISVKVTKTSEETLFQKIIQLVQNAQSEKSPSQLFIEKFEDTYVKAVLLVVGLMLFLPHFLLGWSWVETFYRAMILLVVASPCALVASIMPATLSAISSSARKGILVKGGVNLEKLAGIQAIAFDKTGTLTQGKPKVTDFYTDEAMSKEDIIHITGSIENQSNHPLAQAIVTFTKSETTKHLVEPDYLEDVSGWGIKATINESQWKVGKAAFVGKEEAISFHNRISEELQKEGKTLVYIQRDEKIVGVIALKDIVREQSKRSLKTLKEQGIYTIMLTGDNSKTAQVIALECGIDHYIAECLPETKVNEIKNLNRQYQRVAMVGDGINDAPALASAHVGVAMGEGTDVALETADIVLMKNDLSKITHSIDLSKRLNRIVKQNIIFSILVITFLICSNFLQFIDLPLGVIGHEGSTILVILNGLRLLKS